MTYGLELPGTANHLRQLLMTPDVEAQEPAYSVGFSSGIGAEVSLPEQDKGISFRLIRCSRLVLVVNDGTRPIVVARAPFAARRGDAVDQRAGGASAVRSAEF